MQILFSKSSIARRYATTMVHFYTDNLTLVSIFGEFCKVCYAANCLDCVHFHMACNFSGEAFLKVCNIEIQPLTNRHLQMGQSLIHGGIFLFAWINFEAYKKCLPTHDPSSKQSFGVFIDANDLWTYVAES